MQATHTYTHTHKEWVAQGAQGRMCCGCGYPAAAADAAAAAASALCRLLGGRGCCCCCSSCCPCWWCAFCSATHTQTCVPTDLCPLTEHGLYLQDFFTISGLADWLVGWLAACLVRDAAAAGAALPLPLCGVDTSACLAAVMVL